MTAAEVLTAMDEARRRVRTWPARAIVGGDAPAKHQGIEVKLLDICVGRSEFDDDSAVHVELANEPPCTVMNVPVANLERLCA